MSDAAWHTLGSVVLVVCWGAFALAWVAGAIYNARRGPAVRERSRRNPSWAITAAALVLVLGSLAGISWHSLSVSSAWIRVPGIVLLVSATAFTLWARAALGTMWSGSVVTKDDHALRTDGPYAVTRHPIYTGIAGMLLGTALIDGLGRTAAVCAVAVVALAFKARAEERLLMRAFPEYGAYRERVPWLIPMPPRLAALLRR